MKNEWAKFVLKKHGISFMIKKTYVYPKAPKAFVAWVDSPFWSCEAGYSFNLADALKIATKRAVYILQHHAEKP